MPKRDLFHILPADDWHQAKTEGSYGPASLEREGFIHLSTARQLVKTATRFYRGQRGLLVLRIREESLLAKLVFEPADGDEFPHLYGKLNLDAVVDSVAFPPKPDGTFDFPEAWASHRLG